MLKKYKKNISGNFRTAVTCQKNVILFRVSNGVNVKYYYNSYEKSFFNDACLLFHAGAAGI